MTDGEVRSGSRILTARSWTRAAAVLPVTAVVTIAACSLAAGLTAGSARLVIVPVALLLGVAAGLLWSRARGAEAIHRVVAASRQSAVDSREGSFHGDGDADPRATALAIPRGWRVESARGRLRLALLEVPVRAETWVLRAVVGSRRAPRRREVVYAELPTGAARVHFALGVVADSMLVAPAWGGRPDGRPEPVWAPAVRERLAVHEDLPGALTVGDDRLVLLSLDDPRAATTMRRAALVGDIAAIIGASARPSS